MRKALTVLSMLALAAPGLSSCASLAEELDHFAFAAATPLRDFNLTQTPIPAQLQALAQPYGESGQTGCRAWTQEIEALEQSLRANAGRRVGFRRDGGTFVGRTGNLRDSGVRAAISQFVPYRSVIRQASGASRFEQKAEQASDRARFRIGYLVGLGRANGCPGFGLSSPFAPPQGHQVAWNTPPGQSRAAYHPAFRTVSAQPVRPRHIPARQTYAPPRTVGTPYPTGYPATAPVLRAAPSVQGRTVLRSYSAPVTATTPHFRPAPVRGHAPVIVTRPAMPAPVVTRRVYRPGASAPPATGRQW